MIDLPSHLKPRRTVFNSQSQIGEQGYYPTPFLIMIARLSGPPEDFV